MQLVSISLPHVVHFVRFHLDSRQRPFQSCAVELLPLVQIMTFFVRQLAGYERQLVGQRPER